MLEGMEDVVLAAALALRCELEQREWSFALDACGRMTLLVGGDLLVEGRVIPQIYVLAMLKGFSPVLTEQLHREAAVDAPRGAIVH